MDNEIITNYKNPGHPTAFGGINQVYNFYKRKDPEFKLTHQKVEDLLSGIESYTRHKEGKSLLRNPTFIYYKRQQIQIDLVDVRHLASYNDGYNYLLNGIDVFTRFGFSVPLKTKSANDTLNGFKVLLDKSGENPKTIVSDRGSEIKNKLFYKFCEENKIKVVHTDTSVHAAYVERFNRSIQVLTNKYMTENETYRYIDVLDDLLSTYNNRVHRMIGMTPFDAEKPENSLIIRQRNEERFSKIKRRKPKYKIGQHVRISIQKGKFTRGYNPQQQEEVFKIKSISTALPIPLYRLENYDSDETIEGDFYEFEITPVKKETFVIEKVLKRKTEKRKKWLFVKWRGYKNPSWILESDLVSK